MTFSDLKGKSGELLEKVRFYFEKDRKEKQDKLEKEEFMQELLRARAELSAARNNYNFAKEPALLDYYIYEIKAAETRLNYYLKLAKQNEFSNDAYLSGLVFSGVKRREELG